MRRPPARNCGNPISLAEDGFLLGGLPARRTRHDDRLLSGCLLGEWCFCFQVAIARCGWHTALYSIQFMVEGPADDNNLLITLAVLCEVMIRVDVPWSSLCCFVGHRCHRTHNRGHRRIQMIASPSFFLLAVPSHPALAALCICELIFESKLLARLE
jgi:hypothetical protein